MVEGCVFVLLTGVAVARVAVLASREPFTFGFFFFFQDGGGG